jgi:hypothetical protein
MLERTGNLFDCYDRAPGSWLVITTNGHVRDGRLVMGAGVAGAAKRKFPGLDQRLGRLVSTHGNVPIALRDTRILTWPTKPNSHTIAGGQSHAGWMCVARIDDPSCLNEVKRLTAASGLRLIELVDQLDITGHIFTPRPGCGLGGLDWGQVGPWMRQRFDDRFVVVDPVR